LLGLDVPDGHNQVWQRCDFKGNGKSQKADENLGIIAHNISAIIILQMLLQVVEVDTAAIFRVCIGPAVSVWSKQHLRYAAIRPTMHL
jgi:hypothetical protein